MNLASHIKQVFQECFLKKTTQISSEFEIWPKTKPFFAKKPFTYNHGLDLDICEFQKKIFHILYDNC